MANAIPIPVTGCWIWMGSTNGVGYGEIRRRPKKYYVHRIMCDAPDGYDTLHSCDTPCCIAEEHLSVGTRQDNIDDMMRKGRHWSQKRV